MQFSRWALSFPSNILFSRCWCDTVMLTSLGQECIVSLSLAHHEFTITQTKPKRAPNARSAELVDAGCSHAQQTLFLVKSDAAVIFAHGHAISSEKANRKSWRESRPSDSRHNKRHHEVCPRSQYSRLQLHTCASLRGQRLPLGINKFRAGTTVHRFHMKSKSV